MKIDADKTKVRKFTKDYNKELQINIGKLEIEKINEFN